MAELADAPDCFSGGENAKKRTLEVRILPLQPIYNMDAGDLLLQALLSILIGMMVYLWFLSSIIPHSDSIFDISEKLENTTEQLTPP